MTTATVRSGRSDALDGVVVVGRGPLAVAVVTRLAASSALGRVRSVPELPAVDAQEVLEGASAVVLVADEADLSARVGVTPDERRTAAVAQAQRTVEAARAAGVRQVVAITSAMVHGASPGRAVITDDEVPPAGPGDGLVGDLVATEAVLARAARRRGHKNPTVMVLRPASVVGPGVDTLVTRHFAAPRLLTVRGVDRGWQLVHVDDVASAVELALVGRWSGSATVAAGPVLTPTQVEVAAGMRRIELAAVTAFGTAERLHRVRVIPTPASELAFAVYPWTVDPARLTAAGWVPEHDAHACLAVLLEGVRGQTAVAGRRLGGRDAALGAAGAAVAVLGTAAAWRQARVRRHG